MGERRRATRLPLAVLLLTTVVFAPGLTGGFVYDDWLLIVRNEHIRDAHSLPDVLSQPFWDISGKADRGRAAYSGLWRPWVSLAYVTEFQSFGESPFGYHLVSLLLHLAAVGLVFAFLKRRLPAEPGAWLACAVGAALFAVHPSRPETVSWLSGSTDLWMGFWLLMGLTALAQEKRTVRAFGGLCFALAVWSKEAALLVPILLVTDAWLVERRRPRFDLEGIAAGGALVALAARFLVSLDSDDLIIGGPQVVPRVLSTIGHFCARTVWPYPPSMEPAMRSLDAHGNEVFAAWSIVVGGGVLVGFVVLAAIAWRKQGARPYVADALWYLLLLAPVSNIIDLGAHSLVADRFLYFPLIGVSALAARGVLAATRRRPSWGRRAAAGALAVVLVLAPLTAIRATQFHSDADLWTAELEHNPSSVNGRRQAAVAAEARGDRDLALSHLITGAENARARGSSYEAVRFLLDAARLVLRRTSDADQDVLRRLRAFFDGLAASPEASLSLDELHISARLSDADWQAVRSDVEAFAIPRAISHARTLDLDGAEAQLRSLLEASSRQPAAWNLLIAVYGRQGEWERARQAAQAAERHLPGDPTIAAMTESLARAHAMAAQPAASDVARAVRDARVQTTLGAPEAARRILEPAMAEHPEDPRLVIERAKVDVADGRFDLARTVLESARARDAEHADRWNVALQRLREAEQEAQQRER